ncbi:MAG: hypothetical protein RLZZ338_1678 [Cyanobacteriota bacterium]|jgi:hypothetical protein
MKRYQKLLLLGLTLITLLSSQFLVRAVNCPSYGCLPRVKDETIVVRGNTVTGEAAGIQYYKKFRINCRTGEYVSSYGGSNIFNGKGNIFRVSAKQPDAVMAATIGMSCPE